MTPVLVAVLAYVTVQLLVGFVVARRIRTEADYLVAGRSLGYGLSTFTVFATWFGAETCIGAAGAAYEDGLSGARADPFGYALCLIVMGAVFAVPLWRRKLTTLADLFRQRYGMTVERLAVLLMVPSSVLWASAQIRAFGQVLSATSDLALTVTITIAAGVVIVYTMAGGLLADAVSDLIQGAVLMAGLLVLLFVLLSNTELLHWERALTQARMPNIEARIETIEAWAIPIFGSVVAQELVARVVAAKSEVVAKRSSLAAGGLYLAFGLIPVTIGLVGASTSPDLAHPEQVLVVEAQRLLPWGLYAIFAGALVSAILSTVDSALLVAASLVSHNLVLPLRPTLSEAAKIRWGRTMVLAFGVLSYGLALSADGVYDLVISASSIGTSGIFVVVVFGLFTGFGGSPSAIAALITGVVTFVIGSSWLDLPAPYVTSLGAALAAYVLAARQRQ